VKQKLRFVVVMVFSVATGVASLHAQEEQKETLGDKLKRLFVHPTPTPTPRRTHKRSSPSPAIAPTATPFSSMMSASQESATPAASASERSSVYPEEGAPAVTSPIQVRPESTQDAESQYFEPVRPISPGPRSRTQIIAPQTMSAPTATPTPPPEIASKAEPEERPTPSLPEMIPNAQSPTLTLTASPMPLPKKTRTPVIPIDGISESSAYSPDVKKIVDIGLDLTTRNLTYKYASADPAKGGMDCSGFIWYVFTESGVQNVPRDAREQYAWVRKAGNFQAVLGHSDDTFELDALKPGDLLFWVNNSGVSREPEITQTMIYIGRDHSTNQRLMLGASELSAFRGKRKSGVGVFDFKVGPVGPKREDESSSVFVGYGRIPNSSGN
jgi:peptidoglycan DL-endopeptidase CwlO